MSDDWKPGDLALCIKGGRISRVGGIYIVAEAVPPGHKCGCGAPLWLNGMPLLFVGHTAPDYRGCEPWASSARFRKIEPHASDAEDAETIRLLNGELLPC